MATEGNSSPKPKAAPRKATKELKESLLSDTKFLWSVGWRIALGLLAIGTLLGIKACSSYNSAVESIQKQIDATQTSLSNRISTSDAQIRSMITNTEAELSNRVYTSRAEITNLIVHTFESSNITAIVTEVAADRAGQILEHQVQPEVAKLTNDIIAFSQKIDDLTETKRLQDLKIGLLNSNLESSQTIESNLQATITDAKAALQRLDEQSKFITASIRADHDDREALGQLEKWGSDNSFEYHDLARNLAGRIHQSYFNYNGPYSLVPWSSEATNRNSWSMDIVNQVWNGLPSQFAKDFVDYVSGQTNITTEQRISFLRNMYLKDSHNSLYAQTKAAQYVAEHFGVTYNPAFYFGKIEDKWNQFTRTNHIFDIATNESPDMRYEIIIPSTDTNKFEVLKKSPDSTLVLLKLDHPAVPGTVLGKYFDYTGEHIGEFTLPNAYKNLMWVDFGQFDGSAIKFEFQYKEDSSSTNVLNIQSTPNKLIFDNVTNFSITKP